jgi:hypothetical protein
MSLYRVMPVRPASPVQRVVEHHNTACFEKQNARGLSAQLPFPSRYPASEGVDLLAVLVIPGLAEGERHIAVLDHVLDLLPHCNGRLVSTPSLYGQMKRERRRTCKNEQHQPVHDQHGPEYGHVEDLEPTAPEGDGDGAGGRVPELELGQAADERPELLVLLGREAADRAVLHLAVGRLVGRVELGLQEGEEEVEQVDAERVRDDVPALGDKDAEEEEEEGDACADPSVGDEGGGLVEECLVLLRSLWLARLFLRSSVSVRETYS